MIVAINAVFKAVIAGLSAGLTALAAASVDGSPVSQNEWFVAAGAAVAAFSLVYLTPNTGK